MNRLLYELKHQLFYQMEGVAFHSYKREVEANMTGRIVLDPASFTHRMGSYIVKGEALNKNILKICEGNQYVNTRPYNLSDLAGSLAEDDEMVNVLFVEGAITRDGGACSYGSKEIASYMMKAAAIPQCKAQIVCIDSPGGCAGCEDDFQHGIDAAHAAGQKVYALITGEAYSMGYNFAVRCDEVWAEYPEYGVGCIGCFISGFVLADDTAHAITGEKYVEMYAEQCPDKNRAYRQLTEGNREEMQQQLNGHCQDFIDAVKQGRPNITEEQLKGGNFKAGETLGTMVDRIGTLSELCSEIFQMQTTVPQEPAAEPQEPQQNPAADPDTEETNKTNPKNMNTEKLAQVCGVETLETMDGQVSLNEQLVEAFNATMQQHEDKVTELNGTITEKENKISELQGKVSEQETAISGHAQQVENLNAKITELQNKLAEKETAISGHAQQVENLNGKITELQNKVSEQTTQLSERDQQLQESNTKNTQLTEQLAQAQKDIEEMSHEPNASQNPSAPKTNEEGAEVEDNCQIINKPGLTAAEIAEREQKRMEYLRRCGC